MDYSLLSGIPGYLESIPCVIKAQELLLLQHVFYYMQPNVATFKLQQLFTEDPEICLFEIN